MHAEAFAFVERVSWDMDPKSALELGAYDVNGNCRILFPSVTAWWGVDRRPGPNVDEVADAETWRTKKKFDLVLCTEVLEHATHPEAIVDTAYRALREGGHFVMTCATAGRAPHSDDGVRGVEMQHYQNVSQTEMFDWLDNAGFEVKRLEVNHRACDLYALAVRTLARAPLASASGRAPSAQRRP